MYPVVDDTRRVRSGSGRSGESTGLRITIHGTTTRRGSRPGLRTLGAVKSRDEWDETPDKTQWIAAAKAGYDVCATNYKYEPDDPSYDGVGVDAREIAVGEWEMFRLGKAT